MRLLLTIAVLGSAPGGCARPAADEAGPVEVAGNARAPATAARWAESRPCDLLDRRTVGGALGTEVKAVQSLATGAPVPGGVVGYSCHFALADGQSLEFAPSFDADGIAFGVPSGGAAIVVSGVGREAFWQPEARTLNVQLDEQRAFALTMPADLGTKDPKTLALGLASRIR